MVPSDPRLITSPTKPRPSSRIERTKRRSVSRSSSMEIVPLSRPANPCFSEFVINSVMSRDKVTSRGSSKFTGIDLDDADDILGTRRLEEVRRQALQICGEWKINDVGIVKADDGYEPSSRAVLAPLRGLRHRARGSPQSPFARDVTGLQQTSCYLQLGAAAREKEPRRGPVPPRGHRLRD